MSNDTFTELIRVASGNKTFPFVLDVVVLGESLSAIHFQAFWSRATQTGAISLAGLQDVVTAGGASPQVLSGEGERQV